MLKEVKVWFNDTKIELPIIRNLEVKDDLSSIELEDEILAQLLDDPLLKKQENLTWQISS